MDKGMIESVVYNDNRIIELIKKIHSCIDSGQSFKILCFDIDDTLNRSRSATEEQIEKINFRASEKYREIYRDAHPFFGDEESRDFRETFFDLRNQILEDYGRYCGAIDYNLIHQENRLYPTVKEGLKEILLNKERDTFVVLISHYNPEREAAVKIHKYYEYMTLPNGNNLVDAIITLPVFMQRYDPLGGEREITSKAAYLLKKLNLESKYIFNCILIDDSSRVRRDFKNRGGIVIPAYLELGYIKELEDDPKDINRVITDMDPVKFKGVLDTIDKEMNIYSETKNFKLRKF